MKALLLGVCVSLYTIAIGEAAELPPPRSQPLSAIVKSVEERKLGAITNAEFDHGSWEIEVCKQGNCLKLYIDPGSGEEKQRVTDDSQHELPPPNAKPLSAIIQSLEQRNLGTITEVEFDDGFWEIELRKNGTKTKLDIDSRTGETRR